MERAGGGGFGVLNRNRASEAFSVHFVMTHQMGGVGWCCARPPAAPLSCLCLMDGTLVCGGLRQTRAHAV